MRRISLFAMLAISLFCLTACSFVHSEQRWTTVSQSKEGEPFYRLRVSGKCTRFYTMTMVQLEKPGI